MHFTTCLLTYHRHPAWHLPYTISQLTNHCLYYGQFAFGQLNIVRSSKALGQLGYSVRSGWTVFIYKEATKIDKSLTSVCEWSTINIHVVFMGRHATTFICVPRYTYTDILYIHYLNILSCLQTSSHYIMIYLPPWRSWRIFAESFLLTRPTPRFTVATGVETFCIRHRYVIQIGSDIYCWIGVLPTLSYAQSRENAHVTSTICLC